jgi:hypothetical protein
MEEDNESVGHSKQVSRKIMKMKRVLVDTGDTGSHIERGYISNKLGIPAWTDVKCRRFRDGHKFN